jgi:hypothetical protein
LDQPEFTTRTPVEFILPGNLIIEGELRSVFSPRIIERILASMPIQSRIHLWKKEFYFEIGIRMGLEKAVSSCKAGEIAYWPQGDAICLFFDEMSPYNKVSPIGHFSLSDFDEVFGQIHSGAPITMHQKT